ncbi:MAG: hypothetical protein FWD31_02145, partial [Planctomycetaceae bacterium]|nr:hypothetical protein [Planctomycetaceae bacterium]
MANRYWVASAAGNWSNSANWSATSGGTGGMSVPGVGDTAFLDAGSAANCIIDTTTTVDILNTTGYNGNLYTLAFLTCGHLYWDGKKLC